MKKATKISIQFGFFGVMFLLTSFNILAQPTVIEPGDKSINPALVNTGKFTWGTNITDKANLVSVQRNNQEITIETRETKKGFEESNQTLVLNAKTLEPIRENYKSEEVAYNLQYGSRVKGSITTFETNKKENIDEAITGKHFDTDSLPFVVSALPLSPDYRVTLPVVRFSNGKPNYLRYRITEVSEAKTFLCLLGYVDLWQVTVEEKTRKHRLVIYIEKTKRRILRLEQSFDGMGLSHNTYVRIDGQTDVSPIKAQFNEAETRAMIGNGTSIIKGEASTKDGRPGRSRTIKAPKGTLVMLMPNTPYLKEWIDFNLTIGNISRPVYFNGKLVEGCSYPLPKEVSKHQLVTEVVDDKGNFVFQNLKPGEYLIYVGFVANKYSYTTKVPNGYTITVNPDGTGSASQSYDITDWATAQDVVNHKYVKVSKEGETVSIKLKD